MDNDQEQLTDMEENILDVVEDEIDEQKNEQHLLYKNRIKKLIKEVAESENFIGIAIGKEALDRLQLTTKYMTVILIYEIINILKNKNRKQIKPHFIDKALNKTVASADALGVSINKVDALLKELINLNDETAVGKATEFINFNNTQQEGNKN